IGYWLLVIGYWLLVIGYWLLVIGYWLLLSTVNRQPSTVNCQLTSSFQRLRGTQSIPNWSKARATTKSTKSSIVCGL
ncbi:hypothetical protein QUB75_21810, partial [Microcoleus sp. K1-B6]